MMKKLKFMVKLKKVKKLSFIFHNLLGTLTHFREM